MRDETLQVDTKTKGSKESDESGQIQMKKEKVASLSSYRLVLSPALSISYSHSLFVNFALFLPKIPLYLVRSHSGADPASEIVALSSASPRAYHQYLFPLYKTTSNPSSPCLLNFVYIESRERAFLASKIFEHRYKFIHNSIDDTQSQEKLFETRHQLSEDCFNFLRDARQKLCFFAFFHLRRYQ